MSIFKDVQQLAFNIHVYGFFSFTYTSSTEKSVASIPAFQIFGRILCINIVFEYWSQITFLVKMEVLTYISYKEHFEQYTEV